MVPDPKQKARRLARALISDMLVYHPEKRQQGIRNGTLPQLFKDEIEKIIGIDATDAVACSAKSGMGVDEVLERLVQTIPAPTGDIEAPLQALIIDSWFDNYVGVVMLVRVVEGTLRPREKILLMSTGASYLCEQVGVFTPKAKNRDLLSAGEVGFVTAGIKELKAEKVGDTITLAGRPANQPLAGFKEIKPQVFAGLYPVEANQYDQLRESLEKLKGMAFEGYAIGGLSVGEPAQDRERVMRHVAPRMPQDKPRYLMGMGTPEDIIAAVGAGIDMFDCVLPTRNARNGQLFTSEGPLNIKNAQYADDDRPADPACRCYTCRTHSRAYLRHLFLAGEITASTLNTLHNLYFYLDTMRRIRDAISFGTFEKFRQEFHRTFSRRSTLTG